MSAKTISPFSLEGLDKRLTREWDFEGRRSNAIETALEVKAALTKQSAPLDLDSAFKTVWHANMALWDANALKEAAEFVAIWRTIVNEETRDRDPSGARIWSAILSAELEHRLRHYDIAVDYSRLALSEVRAMAGGEEELRGMLKLGEVTPIAQKACAALAIAIPAGRLYFQHRPTLRSQYLDTWIDEALLILRRDLPPPFFRIHALVIQTYFALTERPSPQVDLSLLNRLERFDDLVRPSTPRGQATKRLRHIARARFEGDVEREISETLEASKDLRSLVRHRRTLTLNRWWHVEDVPTQEFSSHG